MIMTENKTDNNAAGKSENYTFNLEKKDKFEIKVSIKVTPKYFSEQKKVVFNKLKMGVQIKGFRPGMAPQNLIEAKLGPTLFEETINKILPVIAIEILQKEKLNPLNQLHYHLEKVSEAEGLHYHIEFEVMPEVELPDFEKIKVEKETPKITAKEVTAVIEDMFSRGQKDKKGKADEVKGKTDKAKEEAKPVAKPDDKWAAGLEIPSVKTIKDLEKEVEKQLLKQKQAVSEEKYRVEILDKAVTLTGVEVPPTLVARELENREKSYRQRIEAVGLKFEEFLKSRKTSVEELKKEWTEDAEKRIAREILLIEIAKAENLSVKKEEIDKELASIQDPEIKKQYENDKGKNYIATVLIQQKSIAWILKQVEK